MTVSGRATTTTVNARHAMGLPVWSTADTPSKMRLLRGACCAGVLVFAMGASFGFAQQAAQFRAARQHAEQSVRIATLRTELVKADAIATNSFLVGGLEAPGTRATYDTAIAAATRLVASAAANDASDARVLGDINNELAAYVDAMESARTNNRQGFPVGISYLKDGSGQLRSSVLPKLQKLADANASRLQAAYSSAAKAHTIAALCIVVAGVPLAFTIVWLAKTTRRTVNISYFGAAGIVVIGGLVGIIGTQRAQHDANTAHDTTYAATLTLVQARSNAFDAKSAESLTLISRGTGDAYQNAFNKLAADAAVQLRGVADRDVGAAAFDAFMIAHANIHRLDIDGNWDGAVALATSNDRESSNGVFAKFANANASAIDNVGASFRSTLNDAYSAARSLAALTVLAGLMAFGLCLVAMTPRLREYQ